MQPPADVIVAAQAAQIKWKIPASVSLAQWAVESGWGKKSPGNNPFGIKHLAGYPDQQFLSHEVIAGKSIEANEVFAEFPSIAAAFDAHAMLLATRAVYAPALAALPDLYRFVALMAAHYATDPNYAHTIMSVIRGDALTRYDAVPK